MVITVCYPPEPAFLHSLSDQVAFWVRPGSDFLCPHTGFLGRKEAVWPLSGHPVREVHHAKLK